MIKVPCVFKCPYCSTLEEQMTQIVVEDTLRSGVQWQCLSCSKFALVIFKVEIKTEIKKVQDE